MYRTTILLFLSLNWMHFLASSSRLHAEEDAFEDLLEEEAGAAEDFDKLPQSLFIEAEEMMGVSEKAEEGKAWQFSAVPSYTSRKCCNWTSHGLLTQRIRIPKEGVYAVWPRYRLESDKKAPFELRIEKDGKPIFKHRYYSFQVRSGMVKQLQDERHLWFDIAGLQEGVFSGKEWAWEKAEAKLPAGEATLIIEPLGGARDFTLTLDAILLTASGRNTWSANSWSISATITASLQTPKCTK
ncbi:MAG: hypothetical protein O3B01_31685 [Planctomycetota bacterium]|nr:hypothetical protein [Planctomycetota bacterium]